MRPCVRKSWVQASKLGTDTTRCTPHHLSSSAGHKTGPFASLAPPVQQFLGTCAPCKMAALRHAPLASAARCWTLPHCLTAPRCLRRKPKQRANDTGPCLSCLRMGPFSSVWFTASRATAAPVPCTSHDSLSPASGQAKTRATQSPSSWPSSTLLLRAMSSLLLALQ